MLFNHYLIFGYLIKCVILSEPVSTKINIRGRKAVHVEKPIHQYDFRKYYKDLFQSIDIHPNLYGKNGTVVNKNTVRENFNDDIEHDKHTLIFNQVYHFYRKMLDRRKAELNRTRVDKAKEKINAHVNKIEEAMKRRLSRIEYMNHKQFIKQRKLGRMEDKHQKHHHNGTNNNVQNTERPKSRVIDVSRVKNILNDIENYVHNKVEVPEDENLDIAPKEDIRNDGKEELKGKIQNFFGFTKKTVTKFSKRPTRPKTSKTTTRRPTTPDLVQWALNHTDDVDSSEEIKKKGKFRFL